MAQGLLRAGIPVRVFERDATAWDRPQGYRLHLEADALNALREVLTPALHELFLATAMRTEPFTTILSTGLEVVKRLPTGDGHDESKWPGWGGDAPVHANVDRATLRELLLDGLAEAVEFGREVTGFDSNESGVTVHFSDGTSAEGDILVGADGIRSTVRGQLAPHLQTMDAGVQAIYGKVPWSAAMEVAPDAVLEDIFAIGMDDRKVFLGLGAVEFPTTPLAAAAAAGRDGLLTERENYVVCIVGGRHRYFPAPHDDLRRRPAPELQQIALDVIEDWPAPARAVIAAADPESFFSVGMYASVPGGLDAPVNVTLLGDAVHAMTPTLGRGANLAMRDGALLSRAIRSVAEGALTIPAALAEYEAEMIQYSGEVVRESVRVGEQRMAQDPLPEV